ncbi:MAG: methyl-accepting chemotaxis protein, partial [Spirochaetes bacterium]|nr:methyl-accepting chemotaxis protein [Spirochaetota bacterium]
VNYLLNSDPLFIEAKGEVRVISGANIRVSKPIIGKLSDRTYKDKTQYLGYIHPITNKESIPDETSTDFKTFMLFLIDNNLYDGLIATILNEIPIIQQGTLYVLDYKDDILFNNQDQDSQSFTNFKDPEKGIYPELINTDISILKNPLIESVLQGREMAKESDRNTNSIIREVVHNNTTYLTFILDTQDEKYPNLQSGFKVVYLYPKQLLYIPIYSLLLTILIISIVLILLITFFALISSNNIAKPIMNLNYAVSKVTKGKLKMNIITRSRDEIGSLYNHFKEMINQINTVLSNIHKSSSNMLGFQQTLDGIIDKYENSLINQSQLLDNSTKIFQQLDDSIDQIEDKVKNTIQLTKKSQFQVKETNIIIEDLIDEIKRIEQTSKEIHFVADMINQISENTRLLSLNAAIEAKRSGEAGKGFSVVATEIRKLAIQSNQSASEIGTLIKQNEKMIRSGVSKSTEVIDSLRNINRSFNSIQDMVENIGSLMKEEDKCSNKLLINMNTFTDESRKTSRSIEDLAQIRNQLSNETKGMRQLIIDFRDEESEIETIYDSGFKSQEEKARIKAEKKALKERKKKPKKIKKKKRQSETDLIIDSPEKIVTEHTVPEKKKVSLFRKKQSVKELAPIEISIDKFESNIINKIPNEKDQKYVMNLYNKDEFDQQYKIKEKLRRADINKLENILKKINYKP